MWLYVLGLLWLVQIWLMDWLMHLLKGWTYCIVLYRKSITELRSVTCHMGSRSVICHHRWMPRLNPSQICWYPDRLVLDTYSGGMENCVDLGNTKMVYLHRTVTHPCTNLSRRRATSLIGENSLPLRHATPDIVVHCLLLRRLYPLDKRSGKSGLKMLCLLLFV